MCCCCCSADALNPAPSSYAMLTSILSWARTRAHPVQNAARRGLVFSLYASWLSAQVCILFAACLLLSAVTYGLIYWLWVPQPLYTYAVHLSYAPSDSAELLGAPLLPSRLPERSSPALPEAIVDLRDVALGGGWQRGLYAISTPRLTLPILAPHHEYAFSLHLDFVDAQPNWDAGTFMVHVDLLTAAAPPAAVLQAHPLRSLLSDGQWAEERQQQQQSPQGQHAAQSDGSGGGPLGFDGKEGAKAGHCDAPAALDGSEPCTVLPPLPSSDGRHSGAPQPGDPASTAPPAAAVPLEDGSAGDSWRDELVAVPAPMRRLSQQQQQQRRGSSDGSTAQLPGSGDLASSAWPAVSLAIDAAEAGVAERAAADAGAARLLGVSPAELSATRSQASVAPGAFTVLARCSRPVLLRRPQEEPRHPPGRGLLGAAWRLLTWPARTAWRVARWALELAGVLAAEDRQQTEGRRHHALLPRTTPDIRVDINCFDGFIESSRHPTAAVRVTLSSPSVQAPAPGTLEILARLRWPVHAMYHHGALAAAVGILVLASLCCACGGSLGCVALHAALSSAVRGGDRGGGGWSLGWGVPLPPSWVDGAVDLILPPLPQPPEAPGGGARPPFPTPGWGGGEWLGPSGRHVVGSAGLAGAAGRYWLDDEDGEAPARMEPYLPGQWGGSGRGGAGVGVAAAGGVGVGRAEPLSMRSARKPPPPADEAAASGPAEERGAAAPGRTVSEDGETARTGSDTSGSDAERPLESSE